MIPAAQNTLLGIEDIRSARDLIAPFVKRTPLGRSDVLSSELGTNVHVKYELFQKTGSFKVRGAFNKMLSLSSDQLRGGLVAVSGGNHAQAVAYAAGKLDSKAIIVMPRTTPKVYLDATRGYGADVELVDTIAEAFARAGEYQQQGRTFIHPFDDPLVMTGQGTIGLEIMEEVPGVTDVIVSIGGGGLMSGVATAVKLLDPSVRIWGVETEGADAMAKALSAGEPVELAGITSIAKTLGAPSVSWSTLANAQRFLESVTVVPDSEAVAAMEYILERLKVLTEPAASCTLAAARRLKGNFGGESNVVLILCGGNTGVKDLCGYLAA
jgi:threonine dehydratase